MPKNQVIDQIVKRHLSSLSLQELADLISASVSTNVQFTFGDPAPKGDTRVVELPNINAVADFDELMESFRNVHSLTKISAQ